MILCVSLLSFANHHDVESNSYEGLHSDKAMIAIGFGLLAPFLISMLIAISRYWTENYGYKSVELTVDTFMLMGFIEIIFFIQYENSVGYSNFALLCGLGAAFG